MDSAVVLFSNIGIVVDQETVTTASQSGVVVYSLRPRRGCFFMSVDGLKRVILKKIHVPTVEIANNLLGLDFLRQHKVQMHPGNGEEFSLDILSNDFDATPPNIIETMTNEFSEGLRKFM